MPISVIHTADWQIGKAFGNIPGDAGAMLREQRFQTIRRIAELARERAADAVLVAGDVFDSNAVKDETIRRALNAMEGFAGPWVLLPGITTPRWPRASGRASRAGAFAKTCCSRPRPSRSCLPRGEWWSSRRPCGASRRSLT